jgi:hypothetical protein
MYFLVEHHQVFQLDESDYVINVVIKNLLFNFFLNFHLSIELELDLQNF